MIRVTVFRDSDNICHRIIMEGHAGFGEYGQDIVCAAASVLSLNMANSVEAFTDDTFEGSVDEKTGRFEFRFTSDISLESNILMNSLILGLENIGSEYGTQYIKIRFEEV